MAKKVIIVGGGAAGIGAAAKILENSTDTEVLLLEATSKLGGRAKTSTKPIKGLAFDEGPVYIQDPLNPENPWPKIADELGFETVKDKDQYKVRVDIDGVFKTVKTTDLPEARQVENQLQESFEHNKTINNRTVSQPPLPDGQNGKLGLAFSSYGPITESTEPTQYLASDRAREVSEDWGHNLFVKKGLGTLVRTYGDQLVSMYPFRLKVLLNTTVTEINYEQAAVEVSIDNKKYTGDACIVTVSVGVLGNGNIHFVPNLPGDYNMALDFLKLGHYKKLALQFNFLPPEIKDDTNYFLYNEDPEGVWQFYRLSYFPAKVLVVHTAGNFAQQLDQMGDQEVFDLFRDSLRQAYAPNIDYLEDKVSTTNWSGNPFFQGVYSYTTNDPNAPEDYNIPLKARRTMSIPIQNKIYFAGEAYHLEAYGTLHGAYEDGQQAADAVLKALTQT